MPGEVAAVVGTVVPVAGTGMVAGAPTAVRGTVAAGAVAAGMAVGGTVAVGAAESLSESHGGIRCIPIHTRITRRRTTPTLPLSSKSRRNTFSNRRQHRRRHTGTIARA